MLERRTSDRRGGVQGPEGGSRRAPKVVILDAAGESTVVILELPESAAPGLCFCHNGLAWRVTGTRTANRVLIAERADN